VDEREIQTCLQDALRHHQAGRVADAAALYERVLAAQPENADALHLLGLAKHQAGETDAGVAMIERAIALNPNAPDFHLNLAGIFATSRRLSDAAAAVRRAATLRPTDSKLWLRLARYLRQLGRPAEAADAYQRALELTPDSHDVAVNLAVALLDAGRAEDALHLLEQVVRHVPDSAEALANMGLALARLRRHEEALARYDQALALKPELAEVHTNRGASLLAVGRAQDAAEAHSRANELKPHWPAARSNLAIALAQLGRVDEALALHDEVLRQQPDDATSLFNRALIRLSRGDFAGGWPDYEARFRVQELKGQRSFPQPRWEGENPAGQTILVHAEQGLGDTIQFVRYVPRLIARGAKVVIQCDALLVRLLRHSFPDATVVARGEPPPEFDLHVPIMSLPNAFGTLRSTIPAEVPYLSVPPHALADASMIGEEGFRVGLVWSGNPGHFNDRNRSIPLARLVAALTPVPGFRLFSLQKGPGAEQLAALPEGHGVTDLAPSFNDLADSAGAIRRLDLTICVDTSIAHLAGALAAPVWTLLPEPADFRWLIGRDDSPWYPTMRVFRQSEPGNWEAVMERLAAALREFTKRS
jgi:Flp pilus assembly protein TadD